MPRQPAFPGLRHAMKKKQTRREKFLAEMEEVVPWTRLMALTITGFQQHQRGAAVVCGGAKLGSRRYFGDEVDQVHKLGLDLTGGVVKLR